MIEHGVDSSSGKGETKMQPGLIAMIFLSFMMSTAASKAADVRTFTPLHLYYMAPSGCSDQYDGAKPAFGGENHGPWCSPAGHSLFCGDVIIAQAGENYSGDNF